MGEDELVDQNLGPDETEEEKIRRKVEELNIFGQIKLIIPLLGKIKMAALILLSVMLALFIVMALSLGIGLAIIGELIIVVILLILVSPFVSLKRIPHRHIGVPLILGERTSKFILKEGWAVVIHGIFEHEPIFIKKVNLDIELVVRAEDNAQAKVKVSMLLGVDKERANEYLNAGGVFGINVEEKEHKNDDAKGIADSVIDMAESSIVTTSKKKTLDEILELDEEITADAIRIITSAGKNAKIDALKPDVEYNIPGLGMRLSNFVIRKPEPIGKIAEVFEKQAVEMLEREFERTNMETKMLQIQIMIDRLKESGQTIDANSIFLILTEQELLEKGHKITPGLNRLLNGIATMIEGGAGIADVFGNLFNKFKKGDS